MSYQTRKTLFEQIENSRQRPLISYVTSIRPNLSGNMTGDSIDQIIAQIQKIPEDKKEIDFLIISNGGDPITALRIISILRERFNKISVLLPYVAYSAATILSLGADEIIMHPYSNLGPVDPQLTISRHADNGQASQLQFSSEDIRNYIRFLYKGIIIKHNKTEPTYTKTSLFLCEKRRFLWPGLRKEGNLFKLAGPGGLAFFHLTKKEVSKWPMKK